MEGPERSLSISLGSAGKERERHDIPVPSEHPILDLLSVKGKADEAPGMHRLQHVHAALFALCVFPCAAHASHDAAGSSPCLCLA